MLDPTAALLEKQSAVIAYLIEVIAALTEPSNLGDAAFRTAPKKMRVLARGNQDQPLAKAVPGATAQADEVHRARRDGRG